MEHHGENPGQTVYAIIPARYSSTRLPGKMLLPIAGKPLVVHTAERAGKAELVDSVIVVTDDARIRDAVLPLGLEVMMSDADIPSGSDRVALVARSLPEGSVVVNVQGDEPMVSPETIDRTVRAMRESEADIVTVYEPLGSIEELENPNVVKVVTDEQGRALYFSRSPVPFPREEVLKYGSLRKAFENEPGLIQHFKKHIGIYVYRREFLLGYTQMSQTPLEKLEMLEQLRALENGAHIHVVKAASSSIGVDTLEDLERVRSILENGGRPEFIGKGDAVKSS